MAKPAAARATHPVEYNLLLTATLCLLAFGAVMVYSASSAETLLSGEGDGSTYLVDYLLKGSVGVVALLVVARRPLSWAYAMTAPLLAVSLALLLAVKVPGVGLEINGARRWLGVGPLTFQPSEIAKLALVLYGAQVLARKPGRWRHPRQITPLMLVAGTIVVLIASQPDLGTALVCCFTCAALLIAAGFPVRWLAIFAGLGSVAVLLYGFSAAYRRERLMTFLDPWGHAGDAGFQAVQGQIALGSGGFFGRGLGESVQKVFYLPEAHTDFILAIVGEELGVAGILVALVLYGLLAYAGLRVARTARGAYAKLVAAGVTSLILSQALLNVFVVLGLAPLTGVPLPFISYGSTNVVVLLAGMGLLLNVARGGHVVARAVPAASRRDGEVRDRGGRDGGARRAGSGGRRRAAG
jgi:cell division protein FtsW